MSAPGRPKGEFRSAQHEGIPVSAMSPKPENLARLVVLVRGEKVLLDTDLADLYGVATKVLNQAVKRNLDRFPADFMFQLTPDEWERMRSQTVTASRRNVGPLPYAFTEQGERRIGFV
jgi:ORF6N domain